MNYARRSNCFLVLILGYRSSLLGASITWKLNLQYEYLDEQNFVGKVWLVVDGRPHLITNDPIGGYWIVAPANYGERQIPNDAVSACASWWAGNGEDMYIEIKRGRVLVFRRDYGETSSAIPPLLVGQGDFTSP